MSRLSILVSATIKGALVLAGMAFATNAQAACSRAMLQHVVGAYVKAQTDGKASLVPLARARVLRRERPGHGYRQRCPRRASESGFHSRLVRHDAMRRLYRVGRRHTDPHPYVIHTRIEATPRARCRRSSWW